MSREYLWAVVGGVIVAAIGVLFLYLATTGVMPVAFGLFDMNNLGVRATVFVILAVAAIALFFAYRNTSKKASK